MIAMTTTEVQARAALSTPATEPQGYVEGLEAALSAIKNVPYDFHQSAYAQAVDAVASLILAARPAPQPAAETDGAVIVASGQVSSETHIWDGEKWVEAQPAADTVLTDALIGGVGIMQDGKRIDPRDFFAQPAADTRVVRERDLVRWLRKADNNGLNNLADEIRAIIGTATPAPSDKIAEAARAPDLDPVQVGEISNYYGGLWIKAADGVPYWSIEDYSGDTWEVCPMPVFAALRALAGKGE